MCLSRSDGCGPRGPPVTAPASLGVRRISLGSGPFRATAWLIQRMAAELREAGTYVLLEAPAMRHVDLLADVLRIRKNKRPGTVMQRPESGQGYVH